MIVGMFNFLRLDISDTQYDTSFHESLYQCPRIIMIQGLERARRQLCQFLSNTFTLLNRLYGGFLFLNAYTAVSEDHRK